MRAPLVSRRIRAGIVDRRVAAGAFSLAAVALLCTASVARPHRAAIEVSDARAARQLVSLMRTGERGNSLVTYDFTRTLHGGRVLRREMQEGRSSTLHVLVSGSSLTLERGSRVYECNLVEDRSQCTPPTGRSLPAWAVLRIAVNAGAYGVRRTSGETVIGEHSTCYRVRTTGHGYLPDLGTESEVCLANDGIVLRQRVERPAGDRDERVARTVRRNVSAGAVEALAREF